MLNAVTRSSNGNGRPRALVLALAAALATGAGNSAVASTDPSASSRHGTAVAAVNVRHATGASGGRAPIVVQNCDDSGPGSLRDAYLNAVDGDELDLTQLTCSRITLTSGALKSGVPNVSLIGPGSGLLTIDGGYLDRVIQHGGTGDLHIEGLTITQGSYSENKYGGGCLASAGGAYLRDVIVTGCKLRSAGLSAYGGALSVRGDLTLLSSTVSYGFVDAPQVPSGGGGIWSGNSIVVSDSTISDNTLACDHTHSCRGGGILATGNALITNSTISGNLADVGGVGAGICHESTQGYLVVQNSTISDNTAALAGGVYATQQAFIADSTIAYNSATGDFAGAGIDFNTTQAVTMYGTIVANNTSGDTHYEADVRGTDGLIVAGSNNLVMASTQVTLPADTLTDDPLLGPLQDNGGPTFTRALLSGSPAIDRGINVAWLKAFTYDQRGEGFPRTLGTDTDIGAYETEPDTNAIFADGFEGIPERLAR